MKLFKVLLCVVGLGTACSETRAQMNIVVSDAGGNLRIDYSGTLDMSGLTYTTNATLDEHALRLVTPPFGDDYTVIINLIGAPAGRMRVYSAPFSSGPLAYFSSTALIATSYGGSLLYFPTLSIGPNATLRLDNNDFVGNVWSGSGFLQFNNTTIASAGIDPTPRQWVINNTAANTISMTAIPEPTGLAWVAAGASLLAVGWRRLTRANPRPATPGPAGIS